MELLKKLVEEYGPSGDEGKIRDIIKKEIKPYVDELYRDKFGNLIARKKGKGNSVLLAAHMDEIGVMVKSIDVDGKVFVSPIGGIEPVVLLGEKVKIITNTGKEIYGVLIEILDLKQMHLKQKDQCIIKKLEEVILTELFSKTHQK